MKDDYTCSVGTRYHYEVKFAGKQTMNTWIYNWDYYDNLLTIHCGTMDDSERRRYVYLFTFLCTLGIRPKGKKMYE